MRPCWCFGNLAAGSDKQLTVQGWLYDVKNIASPQVLGKQYSDAATTQRARMIAHRFADEIILRLGGGINGIAETQIFYVNSRGGHKEIWAMDYDGANQHAVTTLGNHFPVAAHFAGWLAAGLQQLYRREDGKSACTRST